MGKYQVYLKNRNSSGGGLLTAVDSCLDSTVVSDCNAEILTVQIEINSRKLRIINGYSPQSDDTEDKRLSFWTDLDQEVVSALNEGCFLIIQMDANSKVGREVIPKNPQETVDKNGED